MQDDPLPKDEQARFDALPRAIEPPPLLEDRVVRGLRASGALGPSSRSSAWLRAAAAVVLVAGGFTLGRLTAAGPDPSAAPAGTRYLLLLYGAASASAAEEAARVREYGAWAGEEAAAGRLISGEKLGDLEMIVGGASSQAATPAPSGFFIIRASTQAEAQTIAARCPHVKHGGTVVVKPIEETR